MANRRDGRVRSAAVRLVQGVRRAVTAGGIILLVGACETVQTTAPGEIGVERAQRMSPLVTERDLRQGASDAYAKLVREAAAKGRLNTDRGELERVRAIGGRLIRETRVFRPDAPGWSWEINVLEAPEVNAWCMPGGKIAVYGGLIDKVRPTDAELAAVIGHEIAHALREHARERASRAVTQGVLLGVIGEVAGVGGGTRDLAQLALQVTLDLPNSREQEDEADRIGVELAARAGFDPRAAVTLWEKMSRAGGAAPPEFLSTHPSGEARIRAVGEYARAMMPLYQGR